MHKKSFKPDIESIHEIQKFIGETLEGRNINRKAKIHIDFIIEEVVTNITKYGLNGIVNGIIEVTAKLDKGKSILNIKISDNGIPFNPLKQDAPDINASIENRKPGGLGIFFIKRFVKDIEYSHKNGKNNLNMIIEY